VKNIQTRVLGALGLRRWVQEEVLLEVLEVLKGEVAVNFGWRDLTEVEELASKVVLAMEREVLWAKPLGKEHSEVWKNVYKEDA
jgi:hypothetical protein